MQKIKNSWTYQHIQLVIIMGLVTGIGLARVEFPSLPSNTVEFVRAQEVEAKCVVDDDVCIIDEMLLRFTLEHFEENRNNYMEKSRLESMVTVRDVLLSRMDDSPYVNYQALEEKFGY